MTLGEARDHIGDGVVYRAGSDRAEDGVITGVDALVFVRYAGDAHAKATHPADLTLLAEGRSGMADRLIENTDAPMRHPWPEGILVQGGASGVVFAEGGAYRTAFVEAFPGTFLRGEGMTITDAEDACWAKYETLAACPHDQAFDRRHYTNGSGFCRSCGTWFPSEVTGFTELPEEPREPSLMERAFLGDMGAAAEIIGTVARVDELPEKDGTDG